MSLATSSPGAQTPKTPQASCGPFSPGRRSWVSSPSPRATGRVSHSPRCLEAVPAGARLTLRCYAKSRSGRPSRAASHVQYLNHDDSRRQFLGKMLAVAARIPDAAARDQFADRIAHKARITEDVVRAEIRKAAVSRQTAVTTRELPSFGQLKHAEKALIWGLIHNTGAALEALAELDDDDLEELAGREIFEMARSLHERAAGPLTIGAVAASKYSERPARHEHRRHRTSPRLRRPSARARSNG